MTKSTARIETGCIPAHSRRGTRSATVAAFVFISVLGTRGLSLAQTFKVVAPFVSAPNGQNPLAALIQARDGNFYLRNSNTNGFADLVVTYGMPGDQPVVGDWNGDGITTIGVFRNGTFFLRDSNTAGPPDLVFTLGVPGDIAISGDWDGDGIVTTGVFRPSNGAIYLKNANQTGFADIVLNYGLPGDLPVIGDWDGDGTDTIGVYREGTLYLRNSITVGFADIMFALGITGDRPIAGRWGLSLISSVSRNTAYQGPSR